MENISNKNSSMYSNIPHMNLTACGLRLEALLETQCHDMHGQQALIIGDPYKFIDEALVRAAITMPHKIGAIDDFRYHYIYENQGKRLAVLINEGLDFNEMMNELKYILGGSRE